MPHDTSHAHHPEARTSNVLGSRPGFKTRKNRSDGVHRAFIAKRGCQRAFTLPCILMVSAVHLHVCPDRIRGDSDELQQVVHQCSGGEQAQGPSAESSSMLGSTYVGTSGPHFAKTTVYFNMVAKPATVQRDRPAVVASVHHSEQCALQASMEEQVFQRGEHCESDPSEDSTIFKVNVLTS